MKENLKILSGFLIGIGVGALGSVLLIPEQRAKTKKKILEKTERFVDELESDSVETVDNMRDKLVDTIENYAEKAKDRIKSEPSETN